MERGKRSKHNKQYYLWVHLDVDVFKDRAGRNLRFLEKVFIGFKFLGLFRVFLDFSVQIRLSTKFRPMKSILYTILSVASFSTNYNKLTNHD